MVSDAFKKLWAHFWMRLPVRGPLRRIATRFAGWSVPSYKGRTRLARLTRKGYVSPSATIYHKELHLGAHVFIGDQIIIYQATGGGPVDLGDRVHLHRDIIVETGAGGSLTIGAHTHVQPRCQFSAYKSPIRIGRDVQIAPYCAFYPYDHGITPGETIRKQPLRTKGGITIEDDVWLGVGVLVLDGVRIGKGAVIGAGAVVTKDVPDGAIAAGVPARVITTRTALAEQTRAQDERNAAHRS